jgi:Flagellar biosynthesis protein, FliO
MQQGGATGAGSTGMDASANARQSQPVGGLAGWLLGKLRSGFEGGLRGRLGRTPRRAPRLALVERISLAPRQSLALVEAEGRHLLVATSPDGAPTFYALDGGQIVQGARAAGARNAVRARRNGKPAGRVSW